MRTPARVCASNLPVMGILMPRARRRCCSWVTCALRLPKGRGEVVAAVASAGAVTAAGTGASGTPPLPVVGCDAWVPGRSVGVGAAITASPPIRARDSARVTAMARDFRIKGSCSLTGRRALGANTRGSFKHAAVTLGAGTDAHNPETGVGTTFGDLHHPMR